jgi:hypothetical protein
LPPRHRCASSSTVLVITVAVLLLVRPLAPLGRLGRLPLLLRLLLALVLQPRCTATATTTAVSWVAAMPAMPPTERSRRRRAQRGAIQQRSHTHTPQGEQVGTRSGRTLFNKAQPAPCCHAADLLTNVLISDPPSVPCLSLSQTHRVLEGGSATTWAHDSHPARKDHAQAGTQHGDHTTLQAAWHARAGMVMQVCCWAEVPQERGTQAHSLHGVHARTRHPRVGAA